MDQPVLSIFSSTLSSFQETLSLEDQHEFMQIRTLPDLESVIRNIESEQAKRKSLRNLRKIRPFLNALAQYSQVIEVFVNAKPDLLAFIWGPIKFCLQVTSSSHKAFDALLEAYGKIGDFIPIVNAIENIFHSERHVQLVLADVYKDILNFHRRAISFFKRRGWQIALMISCRSFEDIFGDILQNLERSKHLLLTSADVGHFYQAQDARRIFEEEAAYRRAEDEKAKNFTVLDWLSPVTCLNQHHDLRLKRDLFPNTSTWIFNENVWKSWLYGYEDRNRIFWLSGIPGAGKTVLFSSIVDFLESYDTFIPSKALLFFYCKYNDTLRNRYEEIAKSLIAQLLGNNLHCLNYLHDRALQSGERHLETKHTYSEIICTLVRCYDKVYLGIDGLDECEQLERKDVLSLFHSLLDPSETESNVKIFLASRAERDIEKSLVSSRHLEIRAHHLESDILNYASTKARFLCQKFQFSHEQLNPLIAAVTKQSAGMFLLIRLIMENLQGQGSRGDVLDELKSDALPQGLDQAYDRILSRVKKIKSRGDQRRAKQVLEMLTSTRRTLKLYEIQAMFSICLEDKSVDFENREYVNHLKDLCGPIVEVREHDSVELVHGTAKLFLEENHSTYFVSFAPSLNTTQLCIDYLTFDCFNSSLSDKEVRDYVERGSYGFQDYSILNWAPHLSSLKAKPNTSDSNMSQLARSLERLLLQHYQSISKPLELPSNNDNIFNQEADVSRIMFQVQAAHTEMEMKYNCAIDKNGVTNLFGKLYRTRRFIEDAMENTTLQTPSPIVTRAYGYCPFKCPVPNCAKFYEGFPHRSNRDAHQKMHERPFKCSYEHCEYETVGFPLQTSLDLHIALQHNPSALPLRFSNLKSRSTQEALEDAIDKDDAETVRSLCHELLKQPYSTGLTARAVKKGSINAAYVLIELLGDSGDVISIDKHGNEALFYAAKQGCTDIVKLILEKCGPNEPYPRRQMSKPLGAAVSAGHIDIIHTMIAHHNSYSYEGSASDESHLYGGELVPLAVAVQTDREDVLRLLLENQSVLYSMPRQIRIALLAAQSKRSETFLRMLLMKMHELRAYDLNSHFQFNKKEKAALESGVDAAVDYFLSRAKGKIKSDGGTFNNLLQQAALNGKNEDINPLLDQGASIDHAKSEYGTALQAAARNGHESTIRLLLDRGASVNVVGGTYGTALQAAARIGHESTIRLLLDRGASVNAIGGDYGTALSAAVAGGHLTTIHTLFEAGARHDVARESKDKKFYLPYTGSWGNCQGWHPLHFAANERHADIVRLLIEKGASVRYATSQEVCTALHRAFLLPKYFGDGRDKKKAQSRRVDEYEAKSISIVLLLLSHGAYVNARDHLGNTALHLLLLQVYVNKNIGEVAVARYLRHSGADLDAANNAGETPRGLIENKYGIEILNQILQPYDEAEVSKISQLISHVMEGDAASPSKKKAGGRRGKKRGRSLGDLE